MRLLNDSEVVHDQSYFSIPLHNAALRIWLKRKMARLLLNSGDTLRPDLVKMTPADLAIIASAAEGVISPCASLKLLGPDLKNAEWVKAAKKTWKKGICWKEALSLLENRDPIHLRLIRSSPAA